MNSKSLPLDVCSRGAYAAAAVADEIPLTFRQAAVFLGVSPQTVYLWVERKQIPHLDGAVFKRNDGKIWTRYRDREGNRVRESTFTEDWQEAQRKLRERLQARADKLLEIVRRGEQLQFSTLVDFFLENTPASRENRRGQFARYLAFEKILRRSQTL